MSDFPEHDRLHEISDESQTIGLFLDHGLPEQHLVLYERIVRDCECHACRVEGDGEGWHTEAELETRTRGGHGPVQITEYRPTQRTIQSILAAYFDIDQDKIDAEKEQMLAQMRKETAA